LIKIVPQYNKKPLLIQLIIDFFTSFVEVIKLINGHAECTDETVSEYSLLSENTEYRQLF
jgi:hypothetical protein